MSMGELMPSGGQSRKKVDPKRIKKIQEGGKRANVIHEKSEEHHKKYDVPVAEEQLLKDLEQI